MTLAHDSKSRREPRENGGSDTAREGASRSAASGDCPMFLDTSSRTTLGKPTRASPFGRGPQRTANVVSGGLPLFLKRQEGGVPSNDGPGPGESGPLSLEGDGAALSPQLEVVAASDPTERDADAVADRFCSSEAGAALLRTALNAKPRALDNSSGAPRDGGSLPDGIRSPFEGALGRDFRDVRIHTGENAARLSEQLRAQAFTHGSDIYFNRGRFAPETDAGARLLAHELTHVAQHDGRAGEIHRQELSAGTGANEPASPRSGANRTFAFSEEEMESRLAATPGGQASAREVQVQPDTQARLGAVESSRGRDTPEGGAAPRDGHAGERSGAETGEPSPERGNDEASRRREGSADTAVGDAAGPRRQPAPPTPGPAAEFEGMLAGDVSEFLEGNLSGERLARLDPRTRELLEAADALGDRSLTDPEATALATGTQAATAGAPLTGYEGEPAWLRTLATIRDVTGQLGGIVGIIGLVATVSGFILSLLIPPVGAFLLTVGRFCDVAALVLDAISLVLGVILTGYNLYRLKNETNPAERRRLLGMVRRDAMGTVMSAVSVATAVAPGAARLLGRGGRRISSGLRTLSRSSSMAGRGARALRRVGLSARLAARGGRRGLRAAGQRVATGFRSLSQSSSLLGRGARGLRSAAVVGRRAAGSLRRRAVSRAQQLLIRARGTAPVRWANRLGGRAEEYARQRLRALATSDSALGRFYNRRLRGFHERNVMVARSINDPIERAYQQRLGRQLNDELDAMLLANPPPARAAGVSNAQYRQQLDAHAQQLDTSMRQRFGSERYGDAQVGVSRGNRVQFVRDDAAFLRQVREAEFAELQLLRDRHPGATPAQLAEYANRSPFIKGRWTPEEMAAFTNLSPNVRRASGDIAEGAVQKTGHHTIPASHSPQIAQDPRFIQIVNDSSHYRNFIDSAYGPGLRHMPDPSTVRVPGAPGRTRQARNLEEATQGMVDNGTFGGFSGTNPADRAHFSSDSFINELRAQGSSGVWVNPRNPSQRFFFNPHLVIGHAWRWDNELARVIFDMNSRLGLNLRRELGSQVVMPALRRSGHVIGPALAQPVENALDRAILSGDESRADSADPAPAARLSVAPESGFSLAPEASWANALSPSLAAALAPGLLAESAAAEEPVPELADPSQQEMTSLDAQAARELAPPALDSLPANAAGLSLPSEDSENPSQDEGPPTPTEFSPTSLVSIREQRSLVVEAMGAVNEYIDQSQHAERDNRLAKAAAETLQERNAEQVQTAETQRGTIAEEQAKLTRAEGAQQNMASENGRATSESDRGKSQADSVQSEGQNVSVEAKPEEPDNRGWLERAWDATVGAAWDALVAPAIRLVRRKVNQVMESINDFIMRMINQALGLDEIEAELNAGGQDITDRRANLGETDVGLLETQQQATQEETRNQQTADQAQQNVEDAQTTRSDAEVVLADLSGHHALLQEEEAAGQEYVAAFNARHRDYFERQRRLSVQADGFAEAEMETQSAADTEVMVTAEPSTEPDATDEVSA